MRFIPTYVGHTTISPTLTGRMPVHPHIRGAYGGEEAHGGQEHRFIPTYVGHTTNTPATTHPLAGSSPHTWGIPRPSARLSPCARFIPTYVGHTPSALLIQFSLSGSSPHTWGIHWTAVRKMAGFSHFSYDFTQKSYFVQGLVFFGVIEAEASPTHRRGRSQCLPGAHGGSVRNL